MTHVYYKFNNCLNLRSDHFKALTIEEEHYDGQVDYFVVVHGIDGFNFIIDSFTSFDGAVSFKEKIEKALAREHNIATITLI